MPDPAPVGAGRGLHHAQHLLQLVRGRYHTSPRAAGISARSGKRRNHKNSTHHPSSPSPATYWSQHLLRPVCHIQCPFGDLHCTGHPTWTRWSGQYMQLASPTSQSRHWIWHEEAGRGSGPDWPCAEATCLGPVWHVLHVGTLETQGQHLELDDVALLAGSLSHLHRVLIGNCILEGLIFRKLVTCRP